MKLINYVKSYLYFLIPLIILLFLLTIFYYFDIISQNTTKYLKIGIVIISALIGGFQIGQYSNTKGYLQGIILGTIISIIFFIISLFTKDLKPSQILYYLIIIITTTIGGILGINKNHHV